MFGHRDQLALHQAAGRFLGEGQRLLDRGAIVRVERPEHFALIRRLHVLDDRDRIVGIEFRRDVGDFLRLEAVDQILADIIVHLGEHVGVEQIGQRLGERPAILVRGEFEQIGDIGGMERFDQRARRVIVAGLDRVEHRTHEFGLQPVVLVQLIRDVIEFGGAVHGRQIGLAHRLTFFGHRHIHIRARTRFPRGLPAPTEQFRAGANSPIHGAK